MDYIQSIILGFQVALQWDNLLFCFIGVLIGTLVGVLPGLGPTAAISLLLPTTFHVTPVSAIIMLAGIYYGAMYGGSTTSILVNIPGEAASVVTCLDGYQMARKGRAGPALGISAFASFIAGTMGVIGLMLIAPPLAEMALKFGPPEYFSLMIMGLTILTFLASGPMWKALLMAAFGLFLGSIGLDSMTASARFTMDIVELSDGIGMVPAVMGLFGIAEVLLNVEHSIKRSVFETKILSLLPTLQDWKDSIWAIFRGTFIGFFLGVLPGGGAVISSFVSYAVEKKVSGSPEKFGTGMIQGVAGPEAANNAATGGAFIPLLTLGIPANSVMAILLGAMMIHGMQPGPMLIQEQPGLFWGAVTSMYIGNAMLLILNLPLIGLWVRILKVPYPILFPLILLFCLIGAYSLNNSVIEVLIMVGFGLLGYLFKKFEYEATPLILALVLGPMLEAALRRSLLLSAGSPLIFVTRPISGVLMLISFILLAYPLVPWLRRKREILPQVSDDE
ncbi:MAG: tripartite tricarboxylate transporter permease [Pseudomonadota bacterium]|nr:tripartite tricarboxylate transporter permease [Pseudomonadota bacterium]MBU2226192.1 tripartite tricarboxylate transporter permease [Pseudomonadota bacterium]MBU2261304.1 tripartite tricarboxylate transporter permease [Pseudomonadota bacterium]